MRVPARVFADRRLIDELRDDRSLEQLANVATLPGIVEAALAIGRGGGDRPTTDSSSRGSSRGGAPE